MSILGWILFGFVVGLIARAVMPGRDPLGLIGTTVLGILGALAAGWIGSALGLYEPNEGAGFVAATLGAVIVLAVYNMIASRRRISRSTTSSEDRRRAA
ncbi:MAG: GlsB/YeaQ/YmgE family stress response membrane protein [Oligoflexia bacterium]|nr:GlsB/YeaQ/YmgE family stress response membrane protein [Oligoflexia bacterium]